MPTTEFTLRVANAIADVPAEAWDACANPDRDDASSPAYNPFISHDFLSSLEPSGSVRNRTGWQPMHLLAEAPGGHLIGAVPCYAKSHSQGEYVFDHGWADAYERAGGNYYPKLQVCVPFTPAGGHRLLLRPGPQAEAVREALADGLAEVCRRSHASSVHVTFPTETEWQLLGARGYLQRTHRQFHWENAGYDTFDGFLTALASRKRKTIRREREDALANGITVHRLTGADLTESVWDTFFEFYMDTGSRKWGRPISRAPSIDREREDAPPHPPGHGQAQRTLDLGRHQFHRPDTLFGRHWGASRTILPAFRGCYYQAIDYAIGTSSHASRPAPAAPGSRAATCR